MFAKEILLGICAQKTSHGGNVFCRDLEGQTLQSGRYFQATLGGEF